jgi:chromosome segregation ATPase
VDKITQQENEIQDYQTQIANFKNQLEKKKPRRLSLSSQSSEDERGHDSSYPIMSPRLGSPYYDRPSPRRSGLSSPKTRSRPLSPAALQLGVIVETFNQKEQEIEESVNQVIGEFQDSENNLRSQINRLKKQLSQKDNELGRAESQRQVQEEEIERLRELNSKNNQAFTELKKENQQKETLIKKLESEAECAKTDTYYYDQKIKELEAKNREEKRDKEELEKKITHERQEKQLLKKKYEAADSSVAKRIQELEKFRKLSRHESEKLQKIIADKTEA